MVSPTSTTIPVLWEDYAQTNYKKSFEELSVREQITVHNKSYWNSLDEAEKTGIVIGQTARAGLYTSMGYGMAYFIGKPVHSLAHSFVTTQKYSSNYMVKIAANAAEQIIGDSLLGVLFASKMKDLHSIIPQGFYVRNAARHMPKLESIPQNSPFMRESDPNVPLNSMEKVFHRFTPINRIIEPIHIEGPMVEDPNTGEYVPAHEAPHDDGGYHYTDENGEPQTFY